MKTSWDDDRRIFFAKKRGGKVSYLSKRTLFHPFNIIIHGWHEIWGKGKLFRNFSKSFLYVSTFSGNFFFSIIKKRTEWWAKKWQELFFSFLRIFMDCIMGGYRWQKKDKKAKSLFRFFLTKKIEKGGKREAHHSMKNNLKTKKGKKNGGSFLSE